MSGFEKQLPRILKNEGGYVNDPRDPGGETICGISRRAHPNASFLWALVDKAKKDLSPLRLFAFKHNPLKSYSIREEVERVYLACYWEPIQADAFENELIQYQLFDMAVNAGVKRASMLLQKAINHVYLDDLVVDGIIGVKTFRAYNGIPDEEKFALLDRYIIERILFYKSLKHFKTYCYSWIKRIFAE